MANISENLSTVKQSLVDIKNAIVDKGITPTGNITTYADAINQLCLCGESIEGKELCIENVGSAGTFSITKNSSATNFPNLEIKINDGQWFTYGFSVGGTTQITINTGAKLYLRGNNPNGFSKSATNYFTINCTFNYNISGYLTSLISTTDFNTVIDIPDYCFENLFKDQKTLLNTKDLITDNIINVGEEGFYYCFYGCTALTTSPSFNKVTTVGGYSFNSCFYGCTALTTAPNFDKVTTVSDYEFNKCFYGCTALTTVPSFNNLTTVGGYSFNNCFQGCTALTTAPNFDKVTTVGSTAFTSCFNGCTALTTAPNFNNLTTVSVSGFSYCFKGCTNLTITPSFNNLTTVGGYSFNNCFQGCSKLQAIHTPNIATWDENTFENWVDGVASTGVLFKSESLEIPTGTSGIPTGWSVINYVE